MAKSPDKAYSYAEFCGLLKQSGFTVLGVITLEQGLCPPEYQHFNGHPALLIGSRGGEMWEVFSNSPELSDGHPNPLDRWTKRLIGEVSAEMGCKLFHPSDKPYWPFQRIAQSVAGAKPSPLGILIHPEFGLWHALRGLLVLEKSHGFASQINELARIYKEMIHPCDECIGKPCLTACPVGAFGEGTLDVEPCFSHLDSRHEPDCMTRGCKARDACPVGVKYRNNAEQIRFHMKSYRGFDI